MTSDWPDCFCAKINPSTLLDTPSPISSPPFFSLPHASSPLPLSPISPSHLPFHSHPSFPSPSPHSLHLPSNLPLSRFPHVSMESVANVTGSTTNQIQTDPLVLTLCICLVSIMPPFLVYRVVLSTRSRSESKCVTLPVTLISMETTPNQSLHLLMPQVRIFTYIHDCIYLLAFPQYNYNI